MRLLSTLGKAMLVCTLAALAGCGAGLNGDQSFGSGASSSRDERPLVIDDANRVAAGMSHTVALATDGNVYAWGDNSYGQLGSGDYRSSLTPVQVSLDGQQASKVAAGGFHTLALLRDGTVWGWGDSHYGQLGQGGMVLGSNVPGRVVGLDNVVNISAGYLSSFAIRADGSLWGWGRTGGVVRATPIQVRGLSGVKAVAGGVDFVLAVKQDGTLWGWGDNGYRQLGIPQFNVTQPTIVPGIDQVHMVAAGYTHALALKLDGSIWAWGMNLYGQVGSGSGLEPAPVAGLPVRSASDVKAIAASAYNSAVLYTDGSLWAWGANFAGQLGPTALFGSYSPIKVEGLGKVVAISVSNGSLIAVNEDGSAYGIGYNANGQLGNNDFLNTVTAVQVVGRSGVGFLNLGKSNGR